MHPSSDSYLQDWNLLPDGLSIETGNAVLLPVQWRGQAAMLKVSTSPEEIQGYDLLEWWQGQGAAKVLARAHNALLMERATGTRSLAALCHAGQDEQASRIICNVVAQLHQASSTQENTHTHRPPPHTLTPLQDWFQPLNQVDIHLHPILPSARQTIRELLAEPRDKVCLHGDIHHHNILDFGPRGWLAIDPKGLIGERAFDYANLFCNPDAQTAIHADRFLTRVNTVSQHAQLDRRRLLQWILAWCGLSATWHFEDESDPTIALQVATMAAHALTAT